MSIAHASDLQGDLAPPAERLKGYHSVKMNLPGHVHEHAVVHVTTRDTRFYSGAIVARTVVL